MSYDQMCAQLQELAENAVMVISDSDRELIQGLHTLLEIGEEVSASYEAEVKRIYGEYLRNQHL